MSTGLPSPPQTIGPFFHDCLMRFYPGRSGLRQSHAHLEKIRVEGRVTDGLGEPVDDALLEVWHLQTVHGVDGTLSPDMGHFYRVATEEDGYYGFDTVRSRPALDSDEPVVTHLNIHLFARGLLDRLATRAYLGDVREFANDRFLAAMPEDHARSLIAARIPDQENTYRFNIFLQGNDETVFFDI